MNATDNKLYELQKACNRSLDPLAMWVLYAVNRHFVTGRATAKFEKDFCKYPDADFPKLISYCMEHDRSDDGIIKSVKHCITV